MATYSYCNLRAWRSGMDLVELVYALTIDRRECDLEPLTIRLRRSATAIPSSLAEGHGCGGGATGFLFHLSAAEGSLADLRDQIESAGRSCYLSPQQAERALDEAARLARQLIALRDALSRSG